MYKKLNFASFEKQIFWIIFWSLTVSTSISSMLRHGQFFNLFNLFFDRPLRNVVLF